MHNNDLGTFPGIPHLTDGQQKLPLAPEDSTYRVDGHREGLPKASSEEMLVGKLLTFSSLE